MVEQVICNHQVVGSMPTVSLIKSNLKGGYVMVCPQWTENCDEMSEEDVDNCMHNNDGIGCLAIPIPNMEEPSVEE